MWSSLQEKAETDAKEGWPCPAWTDIGQRNPIRLRNKSYFYLSKKLTTFCFVETKSKLLKSRLFKIPKSLK
jgi:hypothetical protein